MVKNKRFSDFSTEEYSFETYEEKYLKIYKHTQDFGSGKYKLDEFCNIIEELLAELAQEPLVKIWAQIDERHIILFGNLMNKYYKEIGVEILFFEGPEVEITDCLWQGFWKRATQDGEYEEKEEEYGLESVWQSFGDTDSGSEGEY